MSRRIAMYALLAATLVGACTIAYPPKERDAILFSERAGFTDVHVFEAHDMWPERDGCSGWGTLSRSFEMHAKDPAGDYADYVVCCGEASNGTHCGFAK